MKVIKPYTKYKDSGIAWLGKIPEHWKVSSCKFLLDIPITDGPHTTPQLLEDGIPFISAEAIKNGNIDFNKKRGYISLEDHNLFSKKYKPQKGDIYMVKSGATTGNIAIVKTESEFNIWSPLAVFRANLKKTISAFLYHALVSKYFKQSVELHWSFGTQQNIGMRVLSNLPITYGSIPEQTTIANFLDYKIAKIDRFIRKKKQLIKLLNEQKAGIINQAVTKGLDPNVKMKNSSIEWLGNIPEHWEMIKLTGVCVFVRGNSSFKKDELLNNGKYVALQYGKTYKVNEVDEEYQFYVNDEFYKVSQIVHYGDVIFVSTSETIEDLGHSVFYNRSDLGLLGGEQILLKPKDDIVNGKYLCYSSRIFAKELKKYATGVKVFRFNINDLKTIYTSVPPIQEQQEIVNYIEAESQRIDKIISTIEKEIVLTQEYKTALIAEAVTGKIDVRDFVVPEVAEEENHEEIEEELDLATEEYQTEELNE